LIKYDNADGKRNSYLKTLKYDFVQIIPNQYFFDLNHVNMQLLISSFSTPNIRIEKRGLVIEKNI